MKTFEVWAEGYAATGGGCDSYLVGSGKGETFKDACKWLLNHDETYNEERNTLWGMKLAQQDQGKFLK